MWVGHRRRSSRSITLADIRPDILNSTAIRRVDSCIKGQRVADVPMQHVGSFDHFWIAYIETPLPVNLAEAFLATGSCQSGVGRRR